MKKLTILIIVLLTLVGCSKTNTTNIDKQESKNLPIKEDPNSVKMGESPLNTKNIDEYLFRNDCIYVDMREVNQFNSEGYIAGFTNVPFYKLIASLNKEANTLYTIQKVVENKEVVIGFGDINSYTPKYNESSKVINDIFNKKKNILLISSAGVESFYTANLLIQLGYDPSKIYNVGGFSNSVGMGENRKIAYRDLPNAKHLVHPFMPFNYNIELQDYDLTEYITE